jgi:GDP-L-fucose synthase
LIKEKIFLAGHNGMVGKMMLSKLSSDSSVDVITANRSVLDLNNQKNVLDFINSHKPDRIIFAAARVGGIYANETYPAEFIYENLQMQNNVIHSAHLCSVKQLLFLGSSCIYPKFSTQPISETSLLKGDLEPTNEPYAIAKIAGIKMCESYNRQYGCDYRSVMPTNLYGPGDNYHAENSHVIPGLIRRVHEAKINKTKCVEIWGSGQPMREFMYVEDMVDACLFIMRLNKVLYLEVLGPGISHINIGTGEDITIANLAKSIFETVGYNGSLTYNQTKPDGTPRKLLNVSKLKQLGWRPRFTLKEGLKLAYISYLNDY